MRTNGAGPAYRFLYKMMFGLLGLGVWSVVVGQAPPGPMPPPPVPPENPITESKRVLGKILFWDEQVSSDNAVACGTCHSPGRAGADGRIGIHPGPDNVTPSIDDIFGSPGVAAKDAGGEPISDPI